jgi:RNA polymerase sigma factor (sigma-70 family)
MTEHVATRRKLKEIPRIATFRQVLDESTLTEQEKEIITLHYLDDKDYRFIGDKLGFSETTIKRKHQKALKKISKIL